MAWTWSPGALRLLEDAAPAVLTTYRRDGSVATSPVWFRHVDGDVEVVIAAGDHKLQHLDRDPRCSLTVFEARHPFQGVRIEGTARLARDEGDQARFAIASRYLGPIDAREFVAGRATAGWVLHIDAVQVSDWDLTGILPDRGGSG